MARTSIPAVPVRTQMFDASSNLTRVWIEFFQSLGGLKQFYDTHALRLDKFSAGDFPVGTQYFETDREIWYTVVLSGDSRVWKYTSGVMRGTLSPDKKPADLDNAGDVGFRFYSTDFAHTYRWNGTAWRYAIEDGDPGSGVIEWWTLAPNNNGVYHGCDGSTVTRSLNTGGTGSITLPNLVGAYPKGAAGYTGAVVAATPGTLSGSTDSAGAHIHTTGAPSATVSINSGTGTPGIAATGTHTHSIDSQGAHTHALTGVSVTGGEPAHVELMAYMRL